MAAKPAGVSEAAQPNSATSDAAGWSMIAFLAMVLLAVQWTDPLLIDPPSLRNLAFASAALAGVAIVYRTVRPQEQFAVMCIGLLQVLLFSTFGGLLSYAFARIGGPLWDPQLAAWDRAIGFDWLTYVRWVDGNEAVAAVLRAAYASLIPQIIVIVIALGFARRTALLRTVLFAAMLSGTITVFLSALFPAVSNFVAHGLTVADFRHVNPFAGYKHFAHLEALRSGTPFIINLREMEGIITFPSYHAGLATVTLWGFWRSGFLWLRAAGCTIATLTILGTPVDGGHYLVDVIAGCLLGGLSIVAAARAVRWSPDLSPLTAWPSRRSRAASAR